MRLLSLVFLSMFLTVSVYSQWNNSGSNIYFNGGNVGIGTSNPQSFIDVQNSGYTGFFIKETSGVGAAQFRFRANFSSFCFDDDAGAEKARVEFDNGTNTMAFINNQDGNILLRANNQNLVWTNNGKLGVGTTNPESELSVNGKIESEEVQVKQDVADYVFHEDYDLMSLENIELFIKKNGHLPRIQTQADVEKNNGQVKLGQLTISLMEKVEELTLHIIELNKRIKSLEK